MLVPVLVRANYKVSTSTEVEIESIVGSNLPLLFTEVEIVNRTGSPSSVVVEGERTNSFANQSDPDFNGTVTTSLFVSQTLGQNQAQKFTVGTLMPAGYGVTNLFTLTHSGPALETWVSVVVRGMIESSISPDPAVIVNV